MSEGPGAACPRSDTRRAAARDPRVEEAIGRNIEAVAGQPTPPPVACSPRAQRRQRWTAGCEHVPIISKTRRKRRIKSRYSRKGGGIKEAINA